MEFEYVAEVYNMNNNEMSNELTTDRLDGTDKIRHTVSFNDNVQEQIFIYNDNIREEMLKYEEETSKELTLNPIKKKSMTLSQEKFKQQKSLFFKAAVNKTVAGKKRLWALRKLKVLVDRRERLEKCNKGEVFDEQEDGLDISDLEDKILKQIKEEEADNKEEEQQTTEEPENTEEPTEEEPENKDETAAAEPENTEEPEHNDETTTEQTTDEKIVLPTEVLLAINTTGLE